MDEGMHCILHLMEEAEYVCPRCNDLLLCAACKNVHASEMGHSPDDCKAVGCAVMHQLMREPEKKQLAKELAKMLRKSMKELEAGFLREIEMLRSNCALTEEQREMQKLNREGRYAELYFYVKGLPVGGGNNNNAAMQELEKRLLKTFDEASEELKKSQSKIIAVAATRMTPQLKPMLVAYKKDEIFLIKPESGADVEEKVLSAFKSTDMSKFKAMFIWPWRCIGDQVALELASILQTHPMSALFLVGYDISDAGVEMLAKAAFHNDSLSMFCLKSIKISDTGAKAVAEAARNSSSLTTFYLDSDEISDSGAKTVAEALKSCPLSIFGLLGGKISDTGAIAVVEIISSCVGTLSAFGLWGTNISDTGAKKVLDMIRSWPLLSEFYLTGQSISEETLAYILKAMTGVSSIRSVNLEIGGKLSKEQMDSCLRGLQQSGIGKQLKLRFSCNDDSVWKIYKKCIAEWNGKFAELRIVKNISFIFVEEVILGDKITFPDKGCLIF